MCLCYFPKISSLNSQVHKSISNILKFKYTVCVYKGRVSRGGGYKEGSGEFKKREVEKEKERA